MTQDYKKEIKAPYTMLTVMEEAERCLLCHDAPCTKACPAGTDPARFIRSVRFRNFKGAAETVRGNNALGASCARVCPTENYCELGCSRCGIDKPIDIGGIQRFVTDFEEAAGMSVLEKGEANGKKVAIVGSGPSGLQAAATLLGLGYGVDIYERDAKAGGFLRTAIPEYRLPNEVVDSEIKHIADLGANFLFGKEVGKDVSMEQLKSDYDAVLVAVGKSVPSVPEILQGCENAIHSADFLREVVEKDGKLNLPDNAIVIGGGDSAMDSATTLKRLGLTNVTCVTRKELVDFRASKEELETARNEGVTIIDGYAPTKVEGKTITFRHRKLDSEIAITADYVVLATGQTSAATGLGLPMDGDNLVMNGLLVADNVFAAGDLVEGDKTVVYAVRKGKEAAAAIDEFLGGK